jgi:hypothetical protein
LGDEGNDAEGRGLIEVYVPKGLKKITNSSEDNRSPGQDMNLELPEYDGGVFSTYRDSDVL